MGAKLQRLFLTIIGINFHSNTAHTVDSLLLFWQRDFNSVSGVKQAVLHAWRLHRMLFQSFPTFFFFRVYRFHRYCNLKAKQKVCYHQGHHGEWSPTTTTTTKITARQESSFFTNTKAHILSTGHRRTGFIFRAWALMAAKLQVIREYIK